MVNPTNYATDLAKVLFALSKITGEGFAAEWANMKAEEILGNGEARTWAEFVEELKQAFDDLNDHATALAGIASLKQGALAAPEFFAKFETLFRQAEMDEVGHLGPLVRVEPEQEARWENLWGLTDARDLCAVESTC